MCNQTCSVMHNNIQASKHVIWKLIFFTQFGISKRPMGCSSSWREGYKLHLNMQNSTCARCLVVNHNIRDPVFVKWLVGWNVIFVITLSNLLKAALKVSLQFISQRFHRSVTFKNILIFLTQNAVSFCCDIFGKLTDNSLCVLLRNKALSLLVMQKKTFFFKDR